ncbi:MAG: BLUF domain-containing protein [Leeuwenhoekiella sp.]
MKFAICYVSTATEKLDRYALEGLMDRSLQNNLKNGFKGILLYSGGNFLQVLEGEKTPLLQLYTKIEQDPRHNGIIQIVGKELEHGSYDGYETGILANEFFYDTSGLLDQYMEPIKGMDHTVQRSVESILKAFLKTRY